MDIAVARDYKLNNSLIGFQQTVPSAAGNRIYDVTAACSSCPGGILYNEDKNWSTALSVDASGAVNDFRLSNFLQTQFDKDIIIQSPTQFQSFQINLRTVVQPQQQLIVNAMLARFDNPSPVLTSLLKPSQLTQAKADFLAALQAGALFTFR
jgi:hypothetical protein